MTDEEKELEFQAFMEDLEYLVDVLKKSFESNDARFYIDDQHNSLFIKLEGLDDYSEKEISEIAAPILNELDLDFEEITLLPM